METEGYRALTMRRLAAEVGIQAPSLYKHFPTKSAVETALIEQGLLEMGQALHDAVGSPGSRGPVSSLLAEYRAIARKNPSIYRLATTDAFRRDQLAPGLEEWAGEPFYLATGDQFKAQALFSFAHGMVALELDSRFPEDSNLDETWAAGARAFSS